MKADNFAEEANKVFCELPSGYRVCHSKSYSLSFNLATWFLCPANSEEALAESLKI